MFVARHATSVGAGPETDGGHVGEFNMLSTAQDTFAGCQQTMFDAWVTLVEHFQNSTMFLGAMGPMVMTNLVVM